MHLLRLASDIAERAGLAAKAGLTFGGSRDLYSVLGYKTSLDPTVLRDRYERGDIAGRVVDAYPDATWRGDTELVEDEDPKTTTAFEAAWNDLSGRLGILSALRRADILSHCGRFSVILLGAPGALESELGTPGPNGLLFLAVYGEPEVKVDQTDTDATSARYGLPSMYRISRASSIKGGSINSRVHWSRIIHLAPGALDDRVYGHSILERVWNRLDDLDKVAGGGSEAFWLRANRGMLFNLESGRKAPTDEELAAMEEKAEEFAHQLRRTMAVRGFDVQDLSTDVANFNNPVMCLIALISGATGIPQRILLGSERGELSSTQDKENWNERVQDRRETYAEPILRDLVDRCIKGRILPAPKVPYTVRWPAVDDLTEGQKAEVAKAWASVNKEMGDTVVTGGEIRDRVLRLGPLQDVLEEAGIQIDVLPEPQTPEEMPE